MVNFIIYLYIRHNMHTVLDLSGEGNPAGVFNPQVLIDLPLV